MVANAAHSIGKPYRVRTARRRGKQPQISIGLNGRPNDMPTMCAAMCLAMRRAGTRETAASTRVEVSYPEAEDFGASCFFGCAWVLKNCPGLTEASAGRDLRSTGLF